MSDTIESLVEELSTEAEEIKTAVGAKPKSKTNTEKPQDSENIYKKRTELLKLSSDGIISKSVAYINRASANVIEKVYAEYEAKRLEKATEFLTDQFLWKFSAMLGGLDAIESPEEMEKELKHDPLLRKDVEAILSYFTPWIPCLGLFSGSMTVTKHVYAHKSKQFGGEKPSSQQTEVYDTVN